MFKQKDPATSYEKQTPSSATLISAGTTLTGDVVSQNDLRIDGSIKGNVKCSAKIIIGATGFVDGNVDGAQADIVGKVQGNINVKELLQLRGECNVLGNIAAGKLQIEPTATFNGKCQMGSQAAAASISNAKANIVQMSSPDVQPAAAK